MKLATCLIIFNSLPSEMLIKCRNQILLLQKTSKQKFEGVILAPSKKEPCDRSRFQLLPHYS